MSTPLLLQVFVEPDGGWRIAVGSVGTSAALGHLAPDAAADLLAGVQAEVGVGAFPVLLVPGDDVVVTAAEERAGRRLSTVFQASPEIARAVAESRGAAAATGQQLVVLVDVRDLALRNLPWECLASDATGLPLESAGDGIVVRLGAGRVRPWGDRVRPVLWCSDAQDPAVSELAEGVRSACRAAAFPDPVSPTGRPRPREATVVFLVGHAQALDQQLRVLGDEGPLSPSTVAHSLQPWLCQAALVVLLMCEGGLRCSSASAGLVDQILAAGAAAVLASDLRLDQDAACLALSGIVSTLGQGRSLGFALAEGRRRVRAAAQPFPDARWWRLGLTVAHADAIGWAPAARQLSAQWDPDDDARTLLCDAMALAEARGQHWLGLEHLALAVPPEMLSDRHVRLAVRRNRARLTGWLDAFEPADGPPHRLSPRLDRVRQALPARFSVDQLAAAIVKDLPPGLAERLDLVSTRVDATELSSFFGDADALDTDSSCGIESSDDLATHKMQPYVYARGGPWQHLEVLGGPEDGRRVRPERGDLVGRSAPQGHAHHALYDHVGGVDPYLSRRHLRGDVDGAVVLQRSGHCLIAADSKDQPAGRVKLSAGDLLALTPLTWLVAVAEGVPRRD
ncbi:MAG: CHAT domain-containing protein [Oligoflexia bacterium]|nr:CHAT domain-containing protein [Oligoflexia bacterium]